MFSGVRTRVDSRRFPEIYNCCNFAFDNIENRNFIFEFCVIHLKYILSLLLNSGVCRSRVKAMPCNGVTMRLSTSVPAYLTKTFSGYFHTKLSN